MLPVRLGFFSGGIMKPRFVFLAIGAAASLLLIPASARAIPAFARQTGASCSACHFQHFPGLTAYGRFFKASGYTLAGGQGLIEDRLLSLSSVLNASVVTKMRYVKTNGGSGTGTDLGEFQLPDEAAVWLGGRVGSNVGFVLEAQLAHPDEPIFASFKMPIGVRTRLGRAMIIPFTTDGMGAPFGFEMLNTGAVSNTRMMEAGDAFSASQYVAGSGSEGKAEGVAFALAGASGFVSVTPWTPSHGTVALDQPAWYLRAAWTPRVGKFDFGLGVQRWLGTAQATNQLTDAWSLDFQAQGRTGDLPIGIYAGYARAKPSEQPTAGFLNLETRMNGGGTEAVASTGSVFIAPPANLFNAGLRTEQAVSLLAEVGIIPGRVTLGAGYRYADNGKELLHQDLAGAVGATFLVAQNIQLQVNHVISGGDAWNGVTGKQKTILMVFAAF
jgi:hypothetical protein